MFSQESTLTEISESQIKTDVMSLYLSLIQLFGRKDYKGAEDLFYFRFSFLKRYFDRRFMLEGVVGELRYKSDGTKNENFPNLNESQLKHRRFLWDLHNFGRCIKRVQTKTPVPSFKNEFQGKGFGFTVDFSTLYKSFNTHKPKTDELNYSLHFAFLVSGLWTFKTYADLFEASLQPDDGKKLHMINSALADAFLETGLFKNERQILSIKPENPELVPRSFSEIRTFKPEEKNEVL